MSRYHRPSLGDRPDTDDPYVAAVFDPPLRWGNKAGHLTDQLLLVDTSGAEHMLLQRAPLRLLGEILYPDAETRTWSVVPHQGTWLTRSSHGIQRWMLTHPAV
jgi:hypothetical protein